MRTTCSGCCTANSNSYSPARRPRRLVSERRTVALICLLLAAVTGLARAQSSTVAVGGTVFRDTNNNGILDSGETGIAQVSIDLFKDNGDDGISPVAGIRSDSDGNYRFEGLLPGDYRVQIGRWEAFYGQALTGLRSSTGNGDPPVDPDNNVDGDDNGFQWIDPDTLIWYGDTTQFVTLAEGSDSNMTLDLGFAPVASRIFVVNSAVDPGDGVCDDTECTLREAVHAANESPGADTIRFNIASTGPHTIRPLSALPDIIEPVILDATSQPGYVGKPLIELDGSLMGVDAPGLRVMGAYSTVRGFVINRFKEGCMEVWGGLYGQNVIQANYLGTDLDGNAVTDFVPTPWKAAINVMDSSDNLIGGTFVGARNVVSGYAIGILVTGSRNRIEGNFIGTDGTGTTAIGNSAYGIQVQAGADNVIGGTAVGAGNVISGNGYGVFLPASWNPMTGVNRVQGNLIGTDATGSLPLGNLEGVFMWGDSGMPTQVIGGTEPGAGNVISGNGVGIDVRTGPVIVQGNLIGTNPSGTDRVDGIEAIYLADNAVGNLIGGSVPEARNVIVGVVTIRHPETHDNVFVGNYFGTDISGTEPLGYGGTALTIEGGAHDNRIGGVGAGEGNLFGPGVQFGVSIYGPSDGETYATDGNTVRGNRFDLPDYARGVQLGWGERVPNDLLDADTGPNGLQNFPVVSAAFASSDSIRILGSLSSTPTSTFTLDFYASTACNEVDIGLPEQYLGSIIVNTDESGTANFDVNLPASVPINPIVTAAATDGYGNTSEFSNCVQVEELKDSTPPVINCPGNFVMPCSVDLLVPLTYTVTATDDVDPSPTVTCSPPSGSGFPVGTTTVTCTARDSSGNESDCVFTVTRASLDFTGFLPPIGGADATGGSFADPVRTFKLGSTVPVKFSLHCDGAAVVTGVHRLEATKYTTATTSDTPIDATPQDAATTGNQFRLSGQEWHFNLDTRATGLSKGEWLLTVILSDGSQHSAWIQLK